MVGAIASIMILLAIAAAHVYWAAGGVYGKAAAIPERNGKPLFAPSAAKTYAVAGGLVLAATLIAMHIGLLPSAALGLIPGVATWGLAVVFAARAIGDFHYVGFFKRVRDTRFARLDTALYSPLCCALAALIAYAAYK